MVWPADGAWNDRAGPRDSHAGDRGSNCHVLDCRRRYAAATAATLAGSPDVDLAGRQDERAAGHILAVDGESCKFRRHAGFELMAVFRRHWHL
jgi:hypothetical protein